MTIALPKGRFSGIEIMESFMPTDFSKIGVSTIEWAHIRYKPLSSLTTHQPDMDGWFLHNARTHTPAHMRYTTRWHTESLREGCADALPIANGIKGAMASVPRTSLVPAVKTTIWKWSTKENRCAIIVFNSFKVLALWATGVCFTSILYQALHIFTCVA